MPRANRRGEVWKVAVSIFGTRCGFWGRGVSGVCVFFLGGGHPKVDMLRGKIM